jgi:hypothetical protein
VVVGWRTARSSFLPGSYAYLVDVIRVTVKADRQTDKHVTPRHSLPKIEGFASTKPGAERSRMQKAAHWHWNWNPTLFFFSSRVTVTVTKRTMATLGLVAQARELVLRNKPARLYRTIIR